MKEFPSAIQEHHLTPIYQGLSSLTGTPDPQLVDMCKNKFHTQIVLCRYLAGRDSYVQTLNGYKTAILLGKSISNQSMVSVVVVVFIVGSCFVVLLLLLLLLLLFRCSRY